MALIQALIYGFIEWLKWLLKDLKESVPMEPNNFVERCIIYIRLPYMDMLKADFYLSLFKGNVYQGSDSSPPLSIT